jgi:hypothetical protein
MSNLIPITIISVLMLTGIIPDVFASLKMSYDKINSDDTITNDVPPSGEGLFCDHPSNPGSCYDRNDNPEYFCVNNPQYTDFCKIIEPICDDEGQIKSTDPECTDEGSPCPENYVRYNEYCASYRVDCDENPTNVYCTGQRRTDGLQRCDEPEHPGYKFCAELK